MRRLLLSLALAFLLPLAGAATASAQDLSISDVSISEGNAGTTAFSFAVTLDAPAGPGGVTFDIATADSTATAGADYVAAALTGQSIPSGSTGPYTFVVTVNGDTAPEPLESFVVNVLNIAGATPADPRGVGMILDDDAVAGVSVDAGVAPAAPRAGQSVTWTTTVTNAGPDPATNAVLSLPLPAETTFGALAQPAGWSCTTPAVGAGGTVICTHPSFAVGSATFTVMTAVAAGTPAGTSLATAPTFMSDTPDPTPGDDMDIATATVAPTADLDLTLTGPATVQREATMALTATVGSDGPDAAAGAALELTVPPAAGFVSLVAPAGWACTTPAVGASGAVACTRTTAPLGDAAFTLTVRATGAAGATIATSGSVSATSFDPDSADDAATASATITAPPVVVPDPPVEPDPPTQPDPQLRQPVVPVAVAVLPAPVAARPAACPRIPSLLGRTVAGARKVLARDGCRVRVVSARRGSARKGFRRVRIVEQSLRPGTHVPGDGVTLTVTRGPVRDPH